MSDIRVFIGEPSSIDPSNGFEHDGALLLRFLCDPLVDFDIITGEPRPAAASSWVVSPDGMEVLFKLRPEVRFHNGRSVIASDYEYSFARLVRPETGSKLSYQLMCVRGYEDVRSGRSDRLSGVESVDPHTLRIRLSYPFHEVPAVFGHRATSAVPYEVIEADPDGFRVRPVSTGPYKILDSWEAGRGLTLERVPEYYGKNTAFPDGGSGYVDRLTFCIYDELEEAYQDWHEGRLDVVKVPPARLPEVGDLGNKFRQTPCALMQYLGFPTQVFPFDDPLVRRAVALAIDRQKIIDESFLGLRPLAHRVLPPPLGSMDEDLLSIQYDPDAARDLISKAGIGPVKTTFAYNAGLGHDGWVTSIIDQINDVLGWQISAKPMEWTEFLRWVPQADTLFRMTWAIDYPSTDNVLYPLFHSSSVGSDNFTGYQSATVDSLIADARATADVEVRALIYREVESLICKDLPLIPLWFGVQYNLVNLDKFDVSGPIIDVFGEPSLRSFRSK